MEAFEDHGAEAGEADETGEPAEVRLCIVTARVAGETLAAKLERGDRWTTAQAERLTRELLETLAYLHELSPPVVHRDVTPGNVMVDDEGRAMLVDFGAVRSLSHQPGQAQTVLGTPGYMAPEQAMGEATPASDLYGLGATLAHVLTHQHPSQLPREGLRISVEGLLGDAGATARVLPGLLAPRGAPMISEARTRKLAPYRSGAYSRPGAPNKRSLLPSPSTSPMDARPIPTLSNSLTPTKV
ncbi:MAG: protein kinase domain-containing protein [Nannocystaceae bacterium]